ncbi:MAG TPA: diguanylate cyclase, partial [Burkholderiales bacterium]|nr:diguanylate cyclase [Burkholderiales bacterium]
MPNRVSLRELLGRAIASCNRENRPLALLMLSIAHLREIKQILGYREGDKLVQEVARRITKELLSADIVA